MVLKRVLNKLKRHLVKKIEVEKHFNENDMIVFEFKLSNFFSFKRKIHADFMLDEKVTPIEHQLTDKNSLKVFVPHHLLSDLENDSSVRIYVNNKLAWITKSANYENRNESLLIGTKYLSTRVSKKITISNHFNDLSFMRKNIQASVSSSSYNSLGLSIDYPVDTEQDHFEIYAFNNRRFGILTAEYVPEEGSIQIKDFSSLAVGLWRLFIKIGDNLYPLTLNDPEASQFKSYFHQIYALNHHSAFYLELAPHSLEIGPIMIDHSDDHDFFQLTFTMEHESPETEYVLWLDDSQSVITKAYPIRRENGKMTVTLSKEDLHQNLFVKRFFIIQQNEEPTLCKFELGRQAFTNTNLVFRTIANSQLVRLKFYRRKDNSLGLKVIQSKVKKIITSVEDFKIEGKIGSIEKFVGSTAYLLLEDRLSLESMKVRIEGDFSIDLKELDLISIKSKGKTILDLFAIIENAEGKIVRKEKIKYKYAKYKKDNYYSYYTNTDEARNQHHFMITTTPFGNLKVETFEMACDIVLPSNFDFKDPNIWLLGERSNTAQDNGIVLFHWLQQNTSIKAYYVIEEDSPDYERIQNNPSVLIFGSPKHFEIAIKAKVLLCTHDFENILPYKPARGFFGYEHTTKVFLQHGVLGRKNVEYHKKYYDLPFDLFIVSSEPEKKQVVMDKMGYEDHEVAVTGLARFDKLVQTYKPKDILLMPTWRDWINNDEQFLGSEYYFAYSNLIQNVKLHALLEEHDINLHFYPHYRAQNYFENGVDNLHDRVKFITLGSDTVQNLLIDHALLITDFSSVSFDFTLLNKPVVFYHFDVDRFFRRGILRPIEETFIGGIAASEDELISIIEDRILHDFANFDLDISGIIKYQDQMNCERIYQQVKKLSQEESNILKAT